MLTAAIHAPPRGLYQAMITPWLKESPIRSPACSARYGELTNASLLSVLIVSILWIDTSAGDDGKWGSANCAK